MSEQKPGRRIVGIGSRTRNAFQWPLRMIGIFVFLVGIGFGSLTVWSAHELPAVRTWLSHPFTLLELIGIASTGIIAGTFVILGSEVIWISFSVEKSNQFIADFSADRGRIDLSSKECYPITLVRPSQEPTEQQQAILLRAASESDTTPAEQLVRPYSGNDA